ncbi:MAG: hypothetical protein U9P71_01480 [Campylobacterota bacterium]|nr:hypothetical protein [Campylobacterota bacterium]
MKQLIECIKNNSIENVPAIEKSICNMICSSSDSVPLSSDTLTNALSLEGEFLVLKVAYDDFISESKSEKIKYKISQSLSVVVSYEDDGSSYEDIKKFVTYFYENSDDKQNLSFGVKKVDSLSKYPITILFSGILPINQIQITLGKKVYELIRSDDAYFIPRFAKHRDDISKEIGIPILPVLPSLNTELEEFKVQLLDLTNGKLIAKFETDEGITKESTEVYLLKLFYIYKVLAEDKCMKKIV